MQPTRASAFHNVVADDQGRVAVVEASANSANDAVLLRADDGIAVHTNNFVALRARKKRATARRCDRRRSKDELVAVLASHGEGGLCRHEDEAATTLAATFAPMNVKRIVCCAGGRPCTMPFDELAS